MVKRLATISETHERIEAILSVRCYACTHCGALPGHVCRSPAQAGGARYAVIGKRSYPHACRRALVTREQRLLTLAEVQQQHPPRIARGPSKQTQISAREMALLDLDEQLEWVESKLHVGYRPRRKSGNTGYLALPSDRRYASAVQSRQIPTHTAFGDYGSNQYLWTDGWHRFDDVVRAYEDRFDD